MMIRTAAIALFLASAGLLPGQERSTPATGSVTATAAVSEPDPSVPGQHHAIFNKAEGTWNVDCNFWSEPGQQPLKSKGKSKFSTMLGGRYLVEHFDGKFGEEPFQMVNTWGYDGQGGYYTTILMDTKSTGFWVLSGKPESVAGTIVTTGDIGDPIEGNRAKTTLQIDDKKMSLELRLENQGQGTSAKMMELHYTR